MGEAAEQNGQEGRDALTALVVRYLDGRRAVIDESSDDICPVYEPDTLSAAAAWLIAERGFKQWCNKAEAFAELVAVTIPQPENPADLEESINAAAASGPPLTWGYVGVADLYAEAG